MELLAVVIALTSASKHAVVVVLMDAQMAVREAAREIVPVVAKMDVVVVVQVVQVLVRIPVVEIVKARVKNFADTVVAVDVMVDAVLVVLADAKLPALATVLKLVLVL